MRFGKSYLLTLCLPLWLATETMAAGQEPHQEQLADAWASFSASLQEAQRSLTDPQYFPPAPTDRNLAEGHRYLLAHLNRLIESELRTDPEFPEFFRSMDMLRKWTGENPDAMYLKAPIDGEGYYKVTAQMANPREWWDSSRVAGPKAPRLVTFQIITDVPGRTGKLAEMALCNSQTLDFITSLEMSLASDGTLELLIGPKRPEGYQGNFLVTRKVMNCPVTGQNTERVARWLSVREIFSDWEQELPLDMDIVRLESRGMSRPPLDAAFMANALETIGREVTNQIRFWNLLQEQALEVRRDVNGDGRRNMPVNGINPPAPPFTAGGVAGARQFYAGGLFELEQDEALVIKVTAPVEPHYLGFQLNNFWFEGPDQQNNVSSLTGYQLPVASDGARYFIIAQQDPGVQGWMATTGYSSGSTSMRFVFREDPEAADMPSAEAFHIKLDELFTVISADTPKVSAEQRREQIAVRQAHIKRRWRNF